MIRQASAMVLCGVAAAGARGAELRPPTVRAFDQYIRETEARLDRRVQGESKFLWVDEDPRRVAQVRAGGVAIESLNNEHPAKVTGGLVHDWIGAVFVPGATLSKTLALMEDYNHHAAYYKPEVMASRLVSRSGDDFKIYLRLQKTKILTVILDTEYDVHYVCLDRARCYSRAYSTRIAEVENPGRPDERTLPPGNDHGFLWRLDSYWRFEERDGGVYIECEAVSLTRTIPAGLGWLIEPIIRSLPRESLERTLRATRAALSGAPANALSRVSRGWWSVAGG